jgi:hypothetical protein
MIPGWAGSEEGLHHLYFIIFNIVIRTNVFSCGGVSSWNIFRLMSLCGSRLMHNETTLAIGGSW